MPSNSEIEEMMTIRQMKAFVDEQKKAGNKYAPAMA